MSFNPSKPGLIRTREYGASGPRVVLLHGGPGAPGYMAPVARRLAHSCRVLEPLQRGNGSEELSVARHVEDLRTLLLHCCSGERPAIAGHSWGAMLALAFAAANPQLVGSLVLVGCGTFDAAARSHLHRTLDERMDEAMRERLQTRLEQCSNADERLKTLGNLLFPLYSFDPISAELEMDECDARAHQESWDDMLRLQEAGLYPAAFSAIKSPVMMLHGAADPHPGLMIKKSLEPHLPQLEYREWERCGHYPWLERSVSDEFFATLIKRVTDGSTRDR